LHKLAPARKTLTPTVRIRVYAELGMSTNRCHTPYLPADIFPGRLSPDLLRRSGRAQSERQCEMGEMKRAIAREEQERVKLMDEQKRMTDRFASTLVIAASIIAAVRLAREQDIGRPSPRLTSVVTDSIGLARMILDRIVR